VNLTTDANNCGTCSHSCLGGACASSTCQPFVLASITKPTDIVSDANSLYVTYQFSSLVGITKSNGNQFGAYGFNAAGIGPATVDATYLYIVLNSSNIHKFKKDFSQATQLLVTNGGYVPGIALGGNGIAWIESDNGNLNLDTTDTNGANWANHYLGSAMTPGPMKSDSNNVFWLTHPGQASGDVYMANVGLTNAGVLSAPAQADPSLLAIDATNAYWFNATDLGIYRSPRNYGSYTALATAAHSPAAIAVDSSYVYWVDPMAGTVNRVPIGGGNASSVASGQGDVEGLAVDANAIYWTRYSAGKVMKLAK
jgi:hypothetical protein